MESKENESLLMDRFRRGKIRAFNQLVKEVSPRYCFFANIIMDDWAISKEIVSCKFAELWKDRAQFDSLISIRQFLYTSIFAECLTRLRNGVAPELSRHQQWLIKEAGEEEFENFIGKSISETELFAILSK